MDIDQQGIFHFSKNTGQAPHNIDLWMSYTGLNPGYDSDGLVVCSEKVFSKLLSSWLTVVDIFLLAKFLLRTRHLNQNCNEQIFNVIKRYKMQ